MELLAPQDLRPLRQEFRQRYDDSFAWAVVESEPGCCRVRITNDDRTGGDDLDDTTISSVDASVEVIDGLVSSSPS